jgi:hypothetical protein
MIQVLPPNPQKSFLQSVLGGVAENIPEAINKYQESKKSAQSLSQEIKLLKKDMVLI